MPELFEPLQIVIDRQPMAVRPGTTVAAAMLLAGVPCRYSVTGQPRTALCGMGTCLECRATVNGIPHRRTCQMLCENGMNISPW